MHCLLTLEASWESSVYHRAGHRIRCFGKAVKLNPWIWGVKGCSGIKKFRSGSMYLGKPLSQCLPLFPPKKASDCGNLFMLHLAEAIGQWEMMFWDPRLCLGGEVWGWTVREMSPIPLLKLQCKALQRRDEIRIIIMVMVRSYIHVPLIGHRKLSHPLTICPGNILAYLSGLSGKSKVSPRNWDYRHAPL